MSTGSNRGYDGVPEWESIEAEHRRKLARAINRINSGKINCTLDVTLRPNQGTTIVVDPRIGATSFLCWMPQTASASAAERAGIYVTSRANGSAILNHAANAAADQVLTIVILA
jgi:LDH2 family malate/lactate/ureidoglycolate dehydrogenase